MSIIKRYHTIKETMYKKENINYEDLEINMEYIVSILNDWLESGEYHREFEALLYLIQMDYNYTGKLYRGITLLKEDIPLEERINYSYVQSFSKSKDIAIEFARNNKVTVDGAVNLDMEDSEVTAIIIEIDLIRSGVNLFRFCKDLIWICDTLLDEDIADDFKEALSFAIKEKEVVILPHMFSDCKGSIKVYSI